MRKIVKWLMNNTLVTLGMVVATAITAGIHEAGEVSATEYRVLVDAWPHAHPKLKNQIKQAIAGGMISRWEYAALIRETIDDVGAISITSSTDIERERHALQHIID